MMPLSVSQFGTRTPCRSKKTATSTIIATATCRITGRVTRWSTWKRHVRFRGLPDVNWRADRRKRRKRIARVCLHWLGFPTRSGLQELVESLVMIEIRLHVIATFGGDHEVAF